MKNNIFKVKQYSRDEKGFNNLVDQIMRFRMMNNDSQEIKGRNWRAHFDEDTILPPPFWPVVISLTGLDEAKTIFDGDWKIMADKVDETIGYTNVNDLWPRFKAKGLISIQDFTKEHLSIDRKNKWKLELSAMFKMIVDFSVDPIVINSTHKWFMKYVFTELVANSFKHAFPHSEQGVSSTAIYVDKNLDMHITICDRGLSIPFTIMERKIERDPVSALRWAFGEGNTTKRDNELGGMGLFRVKQLVSAAKGELYIRSNKAYLSVKPGKEEFRKNFFHLPGTAAYIKVNLKNIIEDIIIIDDDLPDIFKGVSNGKN